MIVGHIGVAFAARSRWRGIPLLWWLFATMAPDILRLGLSWRGFGFWDSNYYSHVLPWSAALAVAFFLFTLAVWRETIPAFAVGVVVASHIALDFVSGHKPLSLTGPTGLDLQQYQQLEFVVEAALLIVGWWLLRRRDPTRPPARRRVLAALLVFQAVYLANSLIERPYATRCIEYPIRPCWVRRHDQPPPW